MSDSSHKAKLKDAVRTLHAQWGVIRSQWNDQQGDRVQHEVIDRAEEAVRLAVMALDQLGEAVARARSECSEGGGV
jgi:hypothetical protein